LTPASTSRPTTYAATVGLVCGTLGVIGAIDGTGGGTWTDVLDSFGIDESTLGPAFAVQSGVVMLVLMVGGILLARLGMRAMLLLGTMLLACVSFAFIELDGLFLFLVLFAVRGAGLALLDLSANTMAMHVERETGKNIMGLVHAGFSGGIVVGAILAFTVYALGGSFGLIHALVGLLVLGFALWALLGPIPAVAISGSGQGFSLQAYRSPMVRICGVAMGLAFAGELLISNFVSVLLRDQLDVSEATSVLAVVVFATMMAIGRVSNGPLMQRYSAIALLRTQGLVLAVGGLALVASSSVGVILAGSLIGGLGVAGVVPTVLSYAARHAGRSAGETAGATLLGGYIGALVLPLIAGGLTALFSIRAGIVLVPLAGLLTVVLSVLLATDERVNARPDYSLRP
jgi:fucose permease